MRALSIVTTCGLLFAAMLGCESRVSLGALCSVSSDCPSPYVCRAGRCRTECVEARDCPFPLECMLVGNVGGCRLPEDGACPRGAMDCGPGLDCIEGRCAQPCTDHDQCASAQTCVATGCDRLPIEDSGCDALSGAGCPDGQRCTATMGCVSLAVGAVLGGELFGPCMDGEPLSCREGLTCVSGRCLRWCEFERDAAGMFTTRVRTSCGPASRCAGSDTSGGLPPPEGFGYCTQPCDPSATTEAARGCPPGMGCGVSIPGGMTEFTVCEPTSMGADRGEPCGGPSGRECLVGLDCIDGVLADATCLAWCDGMEDCVAGETCNLALGHMATDHRGMTRSFGICDPR